jgi:hypothetical protein
MSEFLGSDAFQWLDANAVDSLRSPDEAFDWVFMMTDGDWVLLDQVWDSRPPLWREALAYIVVDGPVAESRCMLLRALRDPNDDVARQAAISLCHQYIEYPDLAIEIDTESSAIMRDLIESGGAANMEPVPEFLERFARPT